MLPPFKITPKILTLVSAIERALGAVDATFISRPEPVLRKQNRIRTVKDSLAIEGNTLSIEQVTAIFDKKRVVGPKKEIIEVQNAIAAYDSNWKAVVESDFRKAHAVLMKDLISEPGKYRSGAVGVIKGNKVSHVAPPAKQVPRLMGDLFHFLKAGDLSPLILSAVIHYEIEFIHPFEDGNGRMGRLWHHVILQKYHPAFEVVPFESVIRLNQKSYYEILEKCDKAGDSTLFVEFSLKLLKTSIDELLEESPKKRIKVGERLSLAKDQFGSKWFSRKDYMKLFPRTSAPTMSRDLTEGVESKVLRKKGEKNKTEYQFFKV